MTETDTEADSRSEKKHYQASSFLTLSLTWPQLFTVRTKLISNFWTLSELMPFPLHHLGQWVSPCCCDHHSDEWQCGVRNFQNSPSGPLSDSGFQSPLSSQEIYTLENSSYWPHEVLVSLDFPDTCASGLSVVFVFSFKFKLKFQPFVQFFGQQLCKRALFFVASGWAWKRGREAVNYFIKADPCLFILETTLSLLMLDFFLSFKVLLGLLDSVSFQILL